MGIEVTVSRHKCIASKCCINLAPGAFELDDTRVSSVHNPAGEPVETLIEAAEACPTGAISVVQDGTKLA